MASCIGCNQVENSFLHYFHQAKWSLQVVPVGEATRPSGGKILKHTFLSIPIKNFDLGLLM